MLNVTVNLEAHWQSDFAYTRLLFKKSKRSQCLRLLVKRYKFSPLWNQLTYFYVQFS